jgi:GNAT superfamily N-acetyltransferase
MLLRIMALVVDSRYQGRGIGKALVEEAEHWAKRQGAVAVALNSGNREQRQGAHRFYLKQGYVKKSVGFFKSLAPASRLDGF